MALRVVECKPGMTFEGVVLVRSLERRKDKNGRDYLDTMLGDRTGEINGKLWNLSTTQYVPEAGQAVEVRGLVDEFNGRIQLKIMKLSAAADADMRELIPCAPEQPETMMARIRETIDSFPTEDLRRLVTEMLAVTGEKLNWYPAAQRMHHAERSGLLHHTTSMLKTAALICDAYPFLCRELLLAGVIIHDLGKVKEMQSDSLGNVSDYSRDGLLVGHLVRGVSDLDQAAARVGIPPDSELLALLEHMMISHHGVPEYGSPRMPMFPEAEVLHWIDTLDARMNEMQGILERTPAGAFSERIHYLEDRRLYHPFFTAQQQETEAPQEEAAQPEGIRTAIEQMKLIDTELP